MTLQDCSVEILNFTKTILLQNSTLGIFAEILNYGSQSETLNVTLKLGSTIIETHEVVVDYQNATVLNITCNTTGFPKGTYLVVVELSLLPGEMDTYDNMRARKTGYDTGDIIAFNRPGDSDVIVIHRTVEKHADGETWYFKTKGDNKNSADYWKIYGRDIIGIVGVVIPSSAQNS